MIYDAEGNVIVFLSAFTDDALNYNVMLLMLLLSALSLLLLLSLLWLSMIWWLLLLLLLQIKMKYDAEGNVIVFLSAFTDDAFNYNVMLLMLLLSALLLLLFLLLLLLLLLRFTIKYDVG